MAKLHSTIAKVIFKETNILHFILLFQEVSKKHILKKVTIFKQLNAIEVIFKITVT